MSSMEKGTIYWHDFETWGVNPQKDHPCQFAGIRTDLDLNIISEPLMIYSRIANDYLPHPQACLVTGITPQQSLRKGLVEAEFIEQIHQQFMRPNTCVVGYNNLRFDDEVTRYTLYRNFYDPYAREWQNGNSRWDIIDMVRACYALRPEGINWPENDEGLPSFKLQDLTQANAIEHAAAHDAMSDVYGTIGLAKLVKQAQPKLYDFLFTLRLKKNVAKLIDCENITPLVHISSKISAAHGCCTWVAPICFHPDNKNALIVLNLALSPEPLFELSVEEIIAKLYTPNHLLEQGEQRLPIKLIHLNKSPVLAPAKVLTEQNAERLGINRQLCLDNLKKIKAHQPLKTKLREVYAHPGDREPLDADYALYSGGFFNDHDKQLMDKVRQSNGDQLTELSLPFSDPRLSTLLFRYKARNYPHTLNAHELDQWQNHRQFRLMDPGSPASIKVPEYLQTLEDLGQQHQSNPDKLLILNELYKYASNL
ncbi:MAG: exodeoxyribonuclease-1 [Paraglaciecola sp.]|jgi:exodeoxyribonuclease-1